MDQQISDQLTAQDKKIDAIYISVEKTRRYFLWTMIITVVTVLLPLIGLIVIIPWFLKTMMGAYTI